MLIYFKCSGIAVILKDFAQSQKTLTGGTFDYVKKSLILQNPIIFQNKNVLFCECYRHIRKIRNTQHIQTGGIPYLSSGWGADHTQGQVPGKY